jgi:parallel beta-helix repeat protein
VPRDFTTIQSAVDAAPEGAIIQVAAGIYHENVVITTPHLRLYGSEGAVLDGNGAGGFGILAVGTAENPLTGIEISGFEIRNFGKGILLLWVEQGRVHRNEVHHNLMGTPIDGIGIELDSTRFTVVSQNLAHNNGRRGIQINRSSDNLVIGNGAHENGTQQLATFAGVGFMVTGEGGHNNQLRENEALRNYGRGFLLSKTLGTTPVTGNVVAQNRAHQNQRSGIAIMNRASGNFVLQNDARWNNLSGLPPCYDCNLVELFTPAPNVWERNLGTFNLEDSCRP